MLESLENSAFSLWLGESPSIWAYPTVLTLHTFGMGVLAGACWMLDLRILGIGRQIPLGSLQPLFPLMWGALSINVVTGSMLFLTTATERGTSTLFLAKMFFVVLGVATIIFLKREIYGMSADPAPLRGTAKLLALASLFLWLAAITAGRLLAYIA